LANKNPFGKKEESKGINESALPRLTELQGLVATGEV